jgi:hypothetical protein
MVTTLVANPAAIGVALRTVDLGDAWQRMANQDPLLLFAVIGILVSRSLQAGQFFP